jgi:hypothetical protein
MTSTIKQLVTNILTEHDMARDFFRSETPKHSQWLTKGSEEDLFLQAAEEAGVTFEHEANHGGEGQGEQYWSVYKFTKGSESVFVKFNGSYQSYNGSEFDEWFFVEAKSVEVVQYFRI